MKPEIICICGSSRFCDRIAVSKWQFEKEGKIAIGLHLLPRWYGEMTGKTESHHFAEQENIADVLDELHLRKIDLADRVHIANYDGYIGERTAIEIDYAKKLNKPITYEESP